MNLFLLDDGRLRVGWRFAFAVLIVFLVNFIAGTLAATIAGSRSTVEETLYRSLLMMLLLGSFVTMARIFDQPEGSVWTYLGLPRRNWWQQAITGAILGFVLIFIAILIIALFFNYHIVRIALNPRSLELPFLVAFILLTGAMAEELMFRGYPFQRLVDAIGKIRAILVLSALFGFVHLRNPHVSDSRAVQVFAFVNTLLIGVALAIAYLRTRALWLPWGLHFAWNFTLGLIFGLPVSGITQFSLLVKAKVRGPEWFLGGGYGLEGGFLGTVMVLLGLMYVVLFVKAAHEDPVLQVDESRVASIQSSG
ncbi:MAG: CPBP family intramembrane glutamic endopeptidase [Terriglobales bacterium]